MGSRGSSSGKANVVKETVAETQVPTKANIIENMNETQLDIEIRKEQRKIASAEKTMGNTPKQENIGAIPLGQLTRGKTQAQKDKIIQSSTNQAVKFTEAYNKREQAQRRLDALQKAKKEVSGTGKAQKQIKDEKIKKTASETKSTLKWKQTQKAGWDNGAYSPKVISAGNFKIEGSSGYFTIYKNGKKIGSVSKLSEAKAIAERLNKK